MMIQFCEDYLFGIGYPAHGVLSIDGFPELYRVARNWLIPIREWYQFMSKPAFAIREPDP
jgi:hypothetical protein